MSLQSTWASNSPLRRTVMWGTGGTLRRTNGCTQWSRARLLGQRAFAPKPDHSLSAPEPHYLMPGPYSPSCIHHRCMWLAHCFYTVPPRGWFPLHVHDKQNSRLQAVGLWRCPWQGCKHFAHCTEFCQIWSAFQMVEMVSSKWRWKQEPRRQRAQPDQNKVSHHLALEWILLQYLVLEPLTDLYHHLVGREVQVDLEGPAYR